MQKRLKQTKRLDGFTIVELIVVIVVIGILSTLTLVGYTGVTQRASALEVQADLKNASTALEIYKTENGDYPVEGSAAVTSLPKGDETTYQYTVSGGQYYLSATTTTSDTLAYYTSSESGTILDGVWENHTPPGPLVWKQIATGNYHTCGIATDNNAYCWGSNNFGQLGDGTTTIRRTPTAINTSGVLAGKKIKQISAGLFFTCAIASDNQAYCWGDNNNDGSGQLGNGTAVDSAMPVAVSTAGVLAGKTVTSISAGGAHACAIASDNNAYCWGKGSYGQLGHAANTDSTVPVAVSTAAALSGKTVLQLSVGTSHSCAVASDNNAYCWGNGNNGEIGNAVSSSRNIPTAVSTAGVLSGKTISKISAGSANNCVVASDNNAYCWGFNLNGQLGNNLITNSNIPVAVNTAGALSGLTIQSIETGNQTCAIASDNNAYCWGYGASGQLGNNATANSSVPVAVVKNSVLNGLTLKSLDSSRYGHVCAIASDDQSYCWGHNSNSQLGNNLTTNSPVPLATTHL